MESIKGISKNNIPSTLRLLNTEAWTLLQYNDTNDNTEKRFTQSILMIGEATKSGFTRVFEDIEDASNRKSTSEISGVSIKSF